MEFRRDDGTMFAASIPLLEYELYTKYTLSVGRGDHWLREIVQYRRGRSDWRALFSTSVSELYVLEIIWNEAMLKRRGTQTLADCDSALERRARDSSLQSMEYDFFVSRYSTRFKKGLEGEKSILWYRN